MYFQKEIKISPNWLAVYTDNVSVLGELFLTLGSLAVRNEFCEEVLSLGGVLLILQAFQKNMGDKVCTVSTRRNMTRRGSVYEMSEFKICSL